MVCRDFTGSSKHKAKRGGPKIIGPPKVVYNELAVELEANPGAELELPRINALSREINCSSAAGNLAKIAAIAAAGGV